MCSSRSSLLQDDKVDSFFANSHTGSTSCNVSSHSRQLEEAEENSVTKKQQSCSPTHTYSWQSKSPSPQQLVLRSPAYSEEFELDPEYNQHSKTALKAKKTTVAGGKQQQHHTNTQRSHQARLYLSPRQLDQATKRVMSAKNRKMAEMKNELEFAQKELNELRTEHRLLQKQNRINERALNKYNSEDSQLAQTIARHQEEVRALKEQLRRYKDRCTEAGAHVKELEAENAKLKKFNDRLREQASQENLPERDSLARRVTLLEDEGAEKDKKIQDLERHLEHLQKNHRHEVAIEVHRHKETQRRIRELDEQLQEATSSLKEKEKILDIQNIYAQRAVRPPHHLNSSAGGSAQNLRFNSTSNSTPRDKMKAYEEKRRQLLEDKWKKKMDVISEEQASSSAPVAAAAQQDESGVAFEELTSADDNSDDERRAQQEREEEARKRQRREANEKKRREQKEENQRERQQMKQKLEEEADRRRYDGEEQQRRLQEQREQDEMEAERQRQLQEQQEREQEDARQRELEMEELRKTEEEERKKKAALLARLRELDMPSDEDKSRAQKADAAEEEKDRKPPLHPSQQQQKSRKQYDFKPSVENLHQGKPAYDQVPVLGYLQQDPTGANRSNRSNRSSVVGSTVEDASGDSAKGQEKRVLQKAKEEKMMADLFGSSDSPPSTREQQRQLPGTGDSGGGGSTGSGRRRGADGGSNADADDPLMELLNGNAGSLYQPSVGRRQRDEDGGGGVDSADSGSGKLLPGRPSASSKRHTLGHSENVDDIEEMML